MRELYHHGIQGQKWGVRNGPPYPLDKGRKQKVTKVNNSWGTTTKIEYENSRITEAKKRFR